ncbi:MMPL family transporter [Gordonia pseudamarae]|uniref:MMPL family transporter n=2 Tax=Gordoniaceae TaxID=85026 RepID=A0ABX6ILT5_9ACTN|nr:MMPL family transporter [Gordonia sp. (in: high G+C Gram-positive bacteria)]QHN27277.1 MMPL family transporter [Gordonia pseudamarae]QHN36160.1 MMPL family transporter [Gordonia pseudamarae]
MLNSLAGWSVRHRWMVVGGWVAAVVSCIILAGAFGGDSITDFADDDRTESGRALATMNAAGGGSAADEARVVFAVDPSVAGGIDNAEVRAEVDALRERITEIDPTTRMADLYATGLSRNVAISPDRRVAYTTLTVESDSDNERNALVEKIKDTATEFDADGVRLSFAGDWFADVAPAGVGEAIGLGLAMIILLIAFGTVVAAGLPLLTALFGVGVGASILILLQNVIETPDFAVSLAAMLGIGVGIDYALLILTRFRSALADGHDVPEAIISAMNTAGRAVVFAGATVTIAIAGLLTQGGVIGPTMTLAGCAGVLAVLVAALTLLPALLAIVGTRVNRLAVPGLRTTPGSEGALAQRWSKIVQRHPYLGVLSALIILGIMLIPAYDLHLGFGDAGNRATSDTTRIAYDDLARGFGDGSNGPLFLVAELPDNPDNGDKLAALAAELDTTDGVASVSPPIGVGSVDGNEVTMLIVTPTTGPQEAATLDLVHHIRDDIVPSSGLPIEMTGATVGGSDFAELTLQRLPLMVAVVLACSFILLALAFRSLVVPVKAIIMNLLSLGASFGVIVAVFQWGWGMELIGVGKVGPTEAWVPIVLFAVAFGLAMDYEVFLVSRIRERFLTTGNPTTSVTEGLAATARVITAAAAIMVCVFASFIFFDDRGLKAMGLGLAVAVFVDATVVRMLLVPSTMEILGRHNWYWPSWLNWVPRVDGMHGSGDDGGKPGPLIGTGSDSAGSPK